MTSAHFFFPKFLTTIFLFIGIAVCGFTQNTHIPKLTSDLRSGISNAEEGMLVFDLNTESFWYFQDGKWLDLNVIESTFQGNQNQKSMATSTPKVDFVIASDTIMSVDSTHLSLLFPDSSTIIGYGAGRLNAITVNDPDEQGRFNTFIGLQSGYNNRLDLNICSAYDPFNIYEGACASHNVFIGSRSGFQNIHGRNNVFIGNRAGYSNFGLGDYLPGEGGSGSDNTFIGFLSGRANLNGDWNTFLGAYSGEFNGTQSDTFNNPGEGFYNTYLGALAGRFNETGMRNTYIGTESGGHFEHLNGNDNVYVGQQSGFVNLGNQNVFLGTQAGRTGDIIDNINRSVAIGYQAGWSMDGDDNIVIGYQAGYNFAGSDKLYIENSASITPLIYGDFDTDHIRINGNQEVLGKMAIGSADEVIDSRLDIAAFENTSYSTDGALMIGSKTASNMIFDQNDILARMNGSAADMHLQRDGGRVILGSTLNSVDDKLFIEAGANQSGLRVRQAGSTKLRTDPNGGLSVGILQTPPVNGLHVEGDISLDGQEISASSNLTIAAGNSIKIVTVGHTIFLDPSGDISITSSGNLNLEATNITLDASNTITLNAGNDVLINANDRIDLAAVNELELSSTGSFIDVNATTDMFVDVGLKFDLSATNEIELTSSNLLDFDGVQLDFDASAIMNLDGANIHLNASNGGLQRAARNGGLVTNPPCSFGCNGVINFSGTSGSVLIGN
jgi:hypothetical protein